MTGSDLTASLARLREADRQLVEAGPTPFALPLGALAPVVAGTVTALGRLDWWVPGLRERVGAVLRDVPVARLIDGFAGARPYRVVPPSASPALRATAAVGLALSQPERVSTVVHLGLGSAADGSFYEALNVAALLEPSVIFVVTVLDVGPEAPVGPQLAVSPGDLAATIGLAVRAVDGTCAQDVHDAVLEAREQGGPCLVEASIG